MDTSFDRAKSLQELEGVDWGEPPYPSYLVTTCHRLRRKPLAEFTVEDLRIMIGQGIGLPYLISLALEKLRVNPFVSGDFYPGDLLHNVLTVPSDFWQTHPDLRTLMHIFAIDLESLLETIEDTIIPDLAAFKDNPRS
ncbi:MAG TPA: contact-dependent growth inhibition system immunity protein [Chloroflexia bacterium]|jgi:hypothetical protein|nr:contact-dependent growth inhibition system immunity protein [Chloroflexia bacterium]